MTDHEFKAQPERTITDRDLTQSVRRELLAAWAPRDGGPLGLCSVAVTDADGIEGPCERDVSGHSWYEGGEHEPLLSMTCMEHSNEAGERMAGLYWFASHLLDDVDRLTAERDRARDLAAQLEAQIARVEALAEDWRYKGEFGWGPWQEGYGPDLEGAVLDDAAARLRAALTEFDDDECPRPDQPANFGKVEDGFGMVVSRCAPGCRVEVVRPGKVQCSPSCLLDPPGAGGE